MISRERVRNKIIENENLKKTDQYVAKDIYEPKPPKNQKPVKIPKVYGYVRVSTLKQVREGNSIAAQTQKIKDYCEQHELIIHDEDILADNGISGKDCKTREQYQKMRNIVSSGDTIITYSLSRLGRNTGQMIAFVDEMKKKEVKIICLDNTSLNSDTSEGNLMIGVSAVFNSFEREKISERTSATMQFMKKEGRLITKPPFGFSSKGNKLIEHPGEQKVIDCIINLLYDYPNVRISKITEELQDRVDSGELVMRTCNGKKRVNSGKKVYFSTVKNIINKNKLRETVEDMRRSI